MKAWIGMLLAFGGYSAQTFADDMIDPYYYETEGNEYSLEDERPPISIGATRVLIPYQPPGTGLWGTLNRYPEMMLEFRNFDENQKNLIIEATKRAITMMAAPAYGYTSGLYADGTTMSACSYSNSTKGVPAYRDFFRESIIIPKIQAVRMTIAFHGENLGSRTLGRATIGTDSPDNRRDDPTNAVRSRNYWWNAQNLEAKFALTLNNQLVSTQAYNDIALWSGTISHELLHQMGYDHSSCREGEEASACFDRVYRNHFVKAFGLCVEAEGKFQGFGFGLTARQMMFD